MTETINDRIETLINDRFDGNKAAFAKSIGLPPTGCAVQFRIKNVDSDREAVYERTKGKGF